MPQQLVNVFWFRRDLRLEDNAGLYHALSGGLPVLPIFIFDKNILNGLEDEADPRINFISTTIEVIQKQLQKMGSSLWVVFDSPINAFKKIVNDFLIDTVLTNHDYEPYATQRDKEVKEFLANKKIKFKTYKDQVIFEKDEVVKNDGSSYAVYTPYSKRWLALLQKEEYKSYHTKALFPHFLQYKGGEIPTLKSMGFQSSKVLIPKAQIDKDCIKDYDKKRDYPALEGTTRLGVHLRFGTISIRKLVSFALEASDVFLKELIWREFFMQVLWHNPNVISQSFKPQYDNIKWRYNEADFEKWCTGQTGYPMVDAGMRQLNETGFMHNRVRMIAASFLVKHLLIDWRWGEAYFAKKLVDFELSSNNGNWQWVAGCGCDAAPYFRIFNPTTQAKKFDSKDEYVRKWVPEFDTNAYVKPMVEHEAARERCLAVYTQALRKNHTAFKK